MCLCVCVCVIVVVVVVFVVAVVAVVLVVVRGWLSHSVIQGAFVQRMAICVSLLLLLLFLLLLFWWRSVVGYHILSFEGRSSREWRCAIDVRVVLCVCMCMCGSNRPMTQLTFRIVSLSSGSLSVSKGIYFHLLNDVFPCWLKPFWPKAILAQGTADQ